MLHIISLYWNVFVLCYTVNAWAIGWKLEWIFFKIPKHFLCDWIRVTSHSAYYGGIFHRAEYISKKFYSWLGFALAF